MALDLEDVIRERRFLAAHLEWDIFSAGHGARWTAERDEHGEIVIAVRFTLRELLDRLEEISVPADADPEPGAEPV
jgi:hypothetical protein